MKVVIGTYRRRAYIERALESIEKHMAGMTELIFVDDSGDAEHADWLRRFGAVVETRAGGYNAAMNAFCRVAGMDAAVWFEEDFELLTDVDLDNMLAILTEHSELAQLALLRGPHFPIEHQHGGLLEGLVARLGDRADLRREPYGWSQLGTFTANPAVWAPGIAAKGWPRGRWSEDRMRDRLIAEGYRFGYLDEIRVRHDGIRSGKGY